MLNFFDSIITSSLSLAGFTPYTDFSQVDTLKLKENCLSFYSIKDIKYSDHIYSLDSSEFGMEVSGHVEVKILGNRNELDNRSFLFINSLISSDKIIITDLSRSQIEADFQSGRLKSKVTFNFKMLVTQSVKGG